MLKFSIHALMPVLFVYLAVNLSGCSKPSQLGLSLVEQDQTDIVFTDTVSMLISCQEAERTETFNRSYMVLGGYSDFSTDAEWGEVLASIYMNFRLTSTGAFFENAVFDSLVLTLDYESSGHYGEILVNKPTQEPLTLDVLRLTEDIIADEPYTSDAIFQTSEVLKSGFEFFPNDTLSITLNDIEYAPHVRIKLDDPDGIALGEFLLNPQGADSAIYESTTNFKNFLKGLHIRTTPGTNPSTVLRLNAKSSLTKLTLHYTDTTDGGNDARTFEYITNEDTEVVNNFEHTHPSELTDNLPTDSVVYVQGMDGLHTKIEFPFVSNLGDVIINKAELLIQLADTGTSEYPEPITIGAKIKDNNGVLQYIDDLNTSLQNIGSYLLFGGYLEAENDSTGFLYRMFITEQLQRIIDGETSESAIYLTTLSALDPQRVKLLNQNSSRIAKLNITYTKLK
jgi:hypothetical protein